MEQQRFLALHHLLDHESDGWHLRWQLKFDRDLLQHYRAATHPAIVLNPSIPVLDGNESPTLVQLQFQRLNNLHPLPERHSDDQLYTCIQRVRVMQVRLVLHQKLPLHLSGPKWDRELLATQRVLTQLQYRGWPTGRDGDAY